MDSAEAAPAFSNIPGTGGHINSANFLDAVLEQSNINRWLVDQAIGKSLSSDFWDVHHICRDVLESEQECADRGLNDAALWFSEMAVMLRNEMEREDLPSRESRTSVKEHHRFAYGKTLFIAREYDKAAFFTKNCTSTKGRFLYYYSRFKSIEKSRLDRVEDNSQYSEKELKNLKQLSASLSEKGHDLDTYCLYLHAVVVDKLGRKQLAISLLQKAIHSNIILWPAWEYLSRLVDSSDVLSKCNLPDHWLKPFFAMLTCHRQNLIDEALYIANELHKILPNHVYLMAQLAMILHSARISDYSIKLLHEVKVRDPCRLTHMDAFSHILYVKRARVELAILAHRAVQIDKYRVETCAIVGNYYSLRGDHDKACLYFQRALKLDPTYHEAWTLLGQEYMELKNPQAAIKSYRKALEANKKDYRAWYNLGQTYEIMKMPYYSLYYYKEAHLHLPNDHRFLIALGVAYERCNKPNHAIMAYKNAFYKNDTEGMSLIQLAELLGRLGQKKKSVDCYARFVTHCVEGQMKPPELGKAYLALAEYHMHQSASENLEMAFECAQLALTIEDTYTSAKSMISQIVNLMATFKEKKKGGEMDMTSPSIDPIHKWEEGFSTPSNITHE